MNGVIYTLAFLLGLLGLVFVIGAQGQVMRFAIGAVLMVSSGALVLLLRLRPQVVSNTTTVEQKIDFTGKEALKQLKCRNCGRALTSENISVKAGAVFVECPACEGTYQIEEAPTW